MLQEADKGGASLAPIDYALLDYWEESRRKIADLEAELASLMEHHVAVDESLIDCQAERDALVREIETILDWDIAKHKGMMPSWKPILKLLGRETTRKEIEQERSKS